MKLGNQRLAAMVITLAFAMVGASYAAVPLYRLFCAATGYNGTPQVAEAAPSARGKRIVNVRFDANVGAGLDWTFEPEIASIDLRTGDVATIFYKVTNRGAKESVGVARYNVAPDAAGAFFNKIACFCFTEQTLAPGESLEMPVAFFLDPALEQDELMAEISGVTLSYTFYPVKKPPLAQAEAAGRKKL